MSPAGSISQRCRRHCASYQHISEVITATGWLHHSTATTIIVRHISTSARSLLPAGSISQRCHHHCASHQHIIEVIATGCLHHSAAAVIVWRISTPARSLPPAVSITGLPPSSCVISEHQRGHCHRLAGFYTALPPSLCVISAHQRGYCYRLAPSQHCRCHCASYQHISEVTATGCLHHRAAAVIVCRISTPARSLSPAGSITALPPSSCVISAHQRGQCYRLAPSQRCRRHCVSYQHTSEVIATGCLHHSAATIIVRHISTSARSVLPVGPITVLPPSLSYVISAHQRGHCHRLAPSQHCYHHGALYQHINEIIVTG
jgi:hypothetical protein